MSSAPPRIFQKIECGSDPVDLVLTACRQPGYRNDAGVADFHAAGRHTHITELVRSGASLPEVKELARHSDIKMTMKYTHIGMEDQARAISNLPMPKANPNGRSATALQMRCIPGVSESPRVASNDNGQSNKNGLNPCNHKGLGTGSRRLSSNDKVPEVGVEPTPKRFAGGCRAVWLQRQSVTVSSPGVEPGLRPSHGRVLIRYTPRTFLAAPYRGIEPRLADS